MNAQPGQSQVPAPPPDELDKLLDDLAGREDPRLSTDRSAGDGKDVLAVMEKRGIARIASQDGWNELRLRSPFFRHCTNQLGEALPAVEGADWAEVLHTQDLFSRYGNEIGSALLLAALPQTYATERGAKVLVGSSGLTRDLTRRIRGTAQFLMLVMLATSAEKDVESYETCNAFTPDRVRAVRDSWQPQSGVRWRVCATLRVHHEAIRRVQKRANVQRGVTTSDVALNQEDLLGALLTFSITVFEVLEQFGITWTEAEQLAYLRTWNVIGGYLGIQGLPYAVAGSPYSSPLPGGLPRTVADARRLLTRIRSRNWRPVDHYPDLLTKLSDTDPGMQLMAALRDELAAALPGPLKQLPAAVIRHLAEPVVRDRLGLGDGGLLQAALDNAPRRRAAVDRFTAVRLPNRARAMWLRQAANTVSRAATVHFIRSADPQNEFVIPGLMDWADGWRPSKESRQGTTQGPADIRGVLGAAISESPGEFGTLLVTTGDDPSPGTLTFLFSDIEGSTAMWERAPQAMSSALAVHDRLLHETFESAGGVVFAHRGDGLSVAFTTALDAVRGAVAAVRATLAQEWTDLGLVRIRIGIHAGEAIRPRRQLLRVAAEPDGSPHGGRPREPDPRLRRSSATRRRPPRGRCVVRRLGTMVLRRLRPSRTRVPGSPSGTR